MNKTSRTISALIGFAWCVHSAVLPPDATVAGKTAGEWTADVWKWGYSQSTNASAILDCTGQFTTNGQPRGLVFFVPPPNGVVEGECARTFTVPENKYVLVPILPITIDNINTEPPYTPEGQRAALDFVLGLRTSLYARIDGNEVPDPDQYRAPSPVFSVYFPTSDNSLSVNYKIAVAGLVEPLIADGFWMMLEPLPIGEHVVLSGGKIPDFFTHEIVSRFTVVPVPPRQWINDLIAVIDELSPEPTRRALRNNLQRAKSFLAGGNKAGALLELQRFKSKVEELVKPSNAATASQLTWAADKTVSKLKSSGGPR